MSQRAVCPECGAQITPGAEQCWLCLRDLTLESSPAAQPVAVRGPVTYSLSTMFLLTTVVAVLCGVLVAVPGLGTFLAILVTPALIRMFAASRRQAEAGRTNSVDQKIVAFLGSLGIMFLISIAAFIAFQAACWATCGLLAAAGRLDGSIFAVSVLSGAACAIVASVWLIKQSWPKRTKKR